MANLSQTISLIFEGLDQTGPAFRSVNDAFSSLNARAQALADPFADLANKILKIDTALAALALTLGGIAYAASVKMESAALDLKKVLDDTDPSVETLTGRMKALALEYGVSSGLLVQSVANFKQAGFSAEESAQLVKDALDLVIAGDVEAAEASEYLIAILKGFKAPASDASQILDILNETSNRYATNVEELAAGMARLSPIANTMGFSFAETAGLLTPVIEVFRSGEQASDALKVGLLSLIDDAKPVREALKSIGVAQHDANGDLRSGRDILMDVARAFLSLDTNQKLYITSTLVGKEQSARMIEVFDGLAKSSEITAAAMNSAGSASKEVALRLASSENQIKSARVAFEELAITLGSQYKFALTGVIAATGELGQATDKALAGGALEPLFERLRPQLEGIENLIRDMAANLPEALEGIDFTRVLEAFGLLGEELSGLLEGLFGDIDLSTVEGLQTALQGVADGFGLLITTTAGIVQSFKPLFQLIGEALREFQTFGAESQMEFGRFLGIAKQVVDMGAGIAAIFLAMAQTGLEAGRIIDTVFGAMRVGINGVQVAFDGLARGVQLVMLSIAENLNIVTFGAFEDEVRDLRLLGDAIDANLTRNAQEAKAGWDQMQAGLSGNNETYQAARDRLDSLSGSLKTMEAAAFEASVPARDLNAEMLDLAETGHRVERVIDPVTGEITLLASAAEAGAQGIVRLTDATGENAQSTQDAIDAARGWRKTVTEVGGELVTVYEQVGGAAGRSAGQSKEAADKTAESLDKAREASEKYQLKLMEIASNERIKTIEASVKLNIAELEAQTKQVEAAFKSIDTTITSTGNLLGDLFKVYGGLDRFSPYEQVSTITQQIELENKRRAEAHATQQELTRAQIDAIQARTQALVKGDALIKVEAAGLEPALEMIWHQILQSIQVRAAAENAEFLLGVGS